MKKKFTMLPIVRTDIFQEVCDRLNEILDSGEYKIGDKLPSERELSNSLSVSRASIRQALKVLEASGRIDIRAGSGTYFIQKTPNSFHINGNDLHLDFDVDKEFMQNLIVARTAIEKAIFESYALKASKSEISILKKLIDDNEKDKVSPVELDDNAGLDLSFEVKVADFVGNKILSSIQSQVHQLWIKSWRIYGFVPESSSLLYNEHCEIIDALDSKDVDLVSELITNHISKEID